MDDDWATIESDLKEGLLTFISRKERKGNRVIDLSEGLDRGIQNIVNDFKQIFNEIQKEIK